MIPKSGNRFSDKIMLKGKIRLEVAVPQALTLPPGSIFTPEIPC
jgi:hypothetical protein